MINDRPLGEFSHNPEPAPEYLRDLSYCVQNNDCDIGFAQDPDCDRLVLVSENGDVIGEEQGLALLIKWMLSRKKGPVVVNIATSRIIDDICRESGTQLFRTKVGEVHVVEEMKKTDASAGGEGNGGIILPEFHYGRDSFAGMSLALEMLAETGVNLSAHVLNLPQYFFFKKKFEFNADNITEVYRYLEQTFPDGITNYIDGLRIDIDDTWIGIRPSNTEPVIRVFVEGKSKEKAQDILNAIEAFLSSFYKNS